MANNRELSQLGSFINIDDTSGNIGIATTATPYVGIGTTNPEYKLDVYGDVNFEGDLLLNFLNVLNNFLLKLIFQGELLMVNCEK